MLDQPTLPLEGGFANHSIRRGRIGSSGFVRIPLERATRIRIAVALASGAAGPVLTPHQVAWLCRVTPDEINNISRLERGSKSLSEFWDIASKAERRALLTKLAD